VDQTKERITSPENLAWAWKKARWLFQHADGPVDSGAVAAFELNLERNLNTIAKRFASSTYRLSPLALLPQPKGPDSNGKPPLRQSFQVSVPDQVAWIAIVNVVGPILDSKMPAWSYGHRLYKAAWFEVSEGDRHLAGREGARI
jgi:hypothetical protein